MKYITAIICFFLLACNQNTEVPRKPIPLDSMHYVIKKYDMDMIKNWEVFTRSSYGPGYLVMRFYCDTCPRISYAQMSIKKNIIVKKESNRFGVKSVGDKDYYYFDSSSRLDTDKYTSAYMIIYMFNLFNDYNLKELRPDYDSARWVIFMKENESIIYKYDTSRPFPVDTIRPEIKYNRITPYWYK